MIQTQDRLARSVVQWRTQEFCSVEGSTNSVEGTEDRENRDLGAEAP